VVFLLHLREIAPDTFFFDPTKVVHTRVGEALMLLFQVLMSAVNTMATHRTVVMISVAELIVFMLVLGQMIKAIRARLLVQTGWAATHFGVLASVNTNSAFCLEGKLLDLVEKSHFFSGISGSNTGVSSVSSKTLNKKARLKGRAFC